MLQLTLYVVAFVALSGLMAAIEAALLNISPAEVEELWLQKAWGAGPLKAITRRITQTIVVMVIFTNTINVLGPILVGRKAIQLYGDVAIGMITMVLTFGTIVFSEIIPKSLGSHYAPLISRSGVDVTLVERERDLARTFRGYLFQPFVLEMFDEMGVLDSVLSLEHYAVESPSLMRDGYAGH